MKKRLFSALLATLLVVASLAMPASAADEVLGQYLYTEIVAYIDNHPLRSYNILGNTYIVVEDLSQYGFLVTWDGVAGRLVIDPTRTAGPDQYTATYKPTATTQPAGTPAGDYYFTMITTWIGETQINGFNIGGSTCILFDDLAAHFTQPGGSFVWSPEDKALYMTSPVLNNAATDAVEAYVKADVAAVAAGQFTEAQDTILEDFRQAYNTATKDRYVALLAELSNNISYKIAGSKIEDNTAEVYVDVTSRDLKAAMDIFMQEWKAEEARWIANGSYLGGEVALWTSINMILDIYGDDSLPKATQRLTVYLDLVDGVWTVNPEKSAAFIDVLPGGMIDGSLFN